MSSSTKTFPGTSRGLLVNDRRFAVQSGLIPPPITGPYAGHDDCHTLLARPHHPDAGHTPAGHRGTRMKSACQ